jgi:hypothetical protein
VAAVDGQGLCKNEDPPIDKVKLKRVSCESADDGPVETSGGAIARNLRACWILGDAELGAVNPEAGDIAVTEVRDGCMYRCFTSAIHADWFQTRD